ncbi:MAG: CRISPR-associated endonuclease Cas1 [Anaerolineae bacterium]
MYPVYVIQQGARLSIANKRLQVEQNGETLLAAPLGQVSEVVIFGNVGLTTPAIGALLLEGKDVVFLSEDGRFKGRLVGELTPHVPLRRAQYRRMDEADFGLRLAQGIVAAKLAHQRTLLAAPQPRAGRHRDHLSHRAAGRGGRHGGAAHHRGRADRP